MNWRHFSAFLWLRWRLRVNQVKRVGMVNAVITALFLVGMIPGVVCLFVGAFAAGAFAVPLIPEDHRTEILTYIWDGIALLFLMAWMLGLAGELQRSEALSIRQFLHLPVSLSSAFIINYLSSLLSVNLLMFVPPMVGFVLGTAVGLTPALLLLLPLLAAFLLALTALSYQLQGWLASLMSNPRRRRTIVVAITMTVILVGQLPNLINLMQPWKRWDRTERIAEYTAEREKLEAAWRDGEMDQAEFLRRQQELTQKLAVPSDVDPGRLAQVRSTATILNYTLPPLWLALGAGAAADGNVLPALLGTLGLGLIGTASLLRGYRTTIRLYTGEFNAAVPKRPSAAPAPEVKPPPSGTSLLERRLPWVSERVSAIATAGCRSVLRAPEAKIILLTPLGIIVVFMGVFFSGQFEPPLLVRPLMAFGAMAAVLMGMVQLIGNQFGYDRSGFRAFVLSPAPRRDILLGKNLALAPMTMGMGVVLVVGLQVILPMRPDHFALVLLQCVAMYLIYCLLGNALSIVAPMAVAAGALKPVTPKALQVLCHVAFAMLFPLFLAPVLLPIGVDFLLQQLGGPPWLPAGLILMTLECGAVVLLYRLVLGWEGRLLHAREQKILEVVTAKAE